MAQRIAEPSTTAQETTRIVAQMIPRFHLNRPAFDDAFSAELLDGYLETLDEEDPGNDYISTMLHHLGRINRIIDDMLVIARLESEKEAPLDVEPFSLHPCVSKVVERLSPLIEKQKDHVEINIPEDLNLTGDHFYWTQVFYNLIENALKQNAENEILIQINAQKFPDHSVQIQVRDNGKGIPPNSLPYIFNRFYRVEKHHSQNKVRGTGLGLSIVKRAVEAHQGRITATSRPGLETVFTIILPPQPDPEAEMTAAHLPDSPPDLS